MALRKVVGATGEQVVKRAFWLAWQACGGPLGMGFLQDRPGSAEEDVWDHARGAGDYSGADALRSKAGEAHGDYVFGRMMKLHIEFEDDTVSTRDEAPTRDYQAWCGRYPSYDALIDAAAKDLGASVV